ncbi:P-loop NTPase fold protein [Streptomyces griseiscabiei]|uniref:P-loop NTPase fold protein n=1 Tax=Streptomyces griseiscabiei TaxID=2993540 RepID=A0ABU4LA15_9ACTN|nr:P-loop NTPase fold protein [Streptomyces griseiscabiei]MBZ3905072.1 hypothetical protein [Streptomyces griseiscabiei]MDX2912009.1 P-loop NTPase fold protein [Streptomyces griseiscabiei]
MASSGVQDPAGTTTSADLTDPAEKAAYLRTVEACLSDFRVTRRLDTRDGVTADAVRTAMHAQPNMARSMEPCAATYADYRKAVDRAHTTRAQLSRAKADVSIDVRTALGWIAVVISVGHLIVRYEPDASFLDIALGSAPLGVALPTMLLWIDHKAASRRNLVNQVLVLRALCSLPFRARRVRIASRKWESDLQRNGSAPVVHRVIDALLRDDPHSVFLTDSYEGLRAARDHGYVVPSSAADQLKSKLEILDGGTVAVCGPRGVGKSTLLDSALRDGDFAIRTHVPATYTPHDFLLSLCIDVYERYIEHEKYSVPPLTRLSGFVRNLRRLRVALRGLRRRAFFGLPAAALVLLGCYAVVRSLWERHISTVRSWAADSARWCGDLAQEVWRGDNLGVSLLLTIVGVSIWLMRGSARWRRRLRAVPRGLSSVAGVLLLAGTALTLATDRELGEHARALSDGFLALALLLMLSAMALWVTGHLRGAIRVGQWSFPASRVFTPAALGSLVLLTWLVHSDENAVAVFLDSQNQARLVGLITAWALLRVGRWRPRPPRPPLVTECGDQLYRLRTVQSTTAGVTSGVSQLVSLGSAHTSGLSSVPVNLPELVATFRSLLARIAQHLSARGLRTIITVDELDRLGSAEQALAFLSEIKAIFGVPHVFYIVSVAEDVGAAFVRRGLPHRDSTDSSLDDVVHVRPCTLEKSKEIIGRRAPGLAPADNPTPTPYVLLAHGLSGGIPRDLIRYGRRIVEMRKQTNSLEFTDISRQLILEEVSETLAGFRTLLGGHQWTSANSAVLSQYRDLMDQLRSDCECRPDTVRQALEAFATAAPTGSAPTDLPEQAASLIHEASAYAYFGLTFLQIFSAASFDQRSKDAAARAPEGHPHFLAETRLELGVSPHSARSLIDEVRRAWGLPAATPSTLGPSSPRPLPPPRLQPCPVHPRR